MFVQLKRYPISTLFIVLTLIAIALCHFWSSVSYPDRGLGQEFIIECRGIVNANFSFKTKGYAVKQLLFHVEYLDEKGSRVTIQNVKCVYYPVDATII